MLKADVTAEDAPGQALLSELSPAGAIPLTAVYSPAATNADPTHRHLRAGRTRGRNRNARRREKTTSAAQVASGE